MEKTATTRVPVPAKVLAAYSRVEREHHLALLQQLKRKRHKGRELVPRSLLKAAQQARMTNLRNDLKAFSQSEYTSPVISLYLNLAADKVAPEPKALVRSFRSMKSQELEKRKDFIQALPKTVRELFTYDLEEIETFLSDYFTPNGAHSLVIFKSGEDLNRVLAVPVRTRDSLTIDPDPYIVPLEAILEEHQRVLFLEVEKAETRFLVYQLGDCFEADRIQSFVPTDRVDKSIPHHAQQHRLTHLEWHLKATAQRAARLYEEESCQAVMTIGEERILHMLEDYLPDALQRRVIGRIYGSPVADPRDRREIIENLLMDHKTADEASAVAEIQEHKPHEEVVSGLPTVIEALNLFLVRRLVVANSLRQGGFVCRQHHFISLEDGQCPFCGEQFLPVENLVDEMVEIARLHGVSVTMVEYREDLLAGFQGIAAILYPHTASAIAV
jgi:predicted Zn-ribbon and HTH transcriptional regulator